ncbi:hypothetical protein E2C01_090437 [Portunus trituberculatus]|uniref:Uncharacterized protein n=1 Tax=Portunus trituberculatus TaxID=210409 RepID=A0A5B7JKW5_PORTR|nr:hypothetical protein [Portunus trituberculatus]
MTLSPLWSSASRPPAHTAAAAAAHAPLAHYLVGWPGLKEASQRQHAAAEVSWPPSAVPFRRVVSCSGAMARASSGLSSKTNPFLTRTSTLRSRRPEVPWPSSRQETTGRRRGGSRNLGWRALLPEVRCSEARRINIEDEIFLHSGRQESLPCYTTRHYIYTILLYITPHNTTQHTTQHHNVLRHHAVFPNIS